MNVLNAYSTLDPLLHDGASNSMHSGADTLRLRIAARRDVAENIVAFDLEDADGMLLPAFTAGAHLEVYCDGQARHYSLCSDPADPLRYTIAVQREAAGRGGSAYLHAHWRRDALVATSSPRNHFALLPAADAPLLIGGGIGITPLLAMAWELHGAGRPFEMHDFASSPQRQAFRAELADAPWRAHLIRHLGRCTDFAPIVGGFSPGRHLYVCGPFAMIDAVIGTARAHGWPDDHLHFERFGAPATRGSPSSPVDGPAVDDSDISGVSGTPGESGPGPSSTADTAFEVELATSGRRIAVAAGQPVSAALIAAGVPLNVSCEQGVCGTCLTRVLAGVPDHRDWLLTPAQQAANDCFTPCCSRSHTPVLVLDL